MIKIVFNVKVTGEFDNRNITLIILLLNNYYKFRGLEQHTLINSQF